MKLLLNTSTATTELIIVTPDRVKHVIEWGSGRRLSRDLLGVLHENLVGLDADFVNLNGLGFYKGPGSFTGLRIGATIMNTLAESLRAPIIGESGEDWVEVCLDRLEKGENDKIVMPFYGAGAHITTPRK